VYSMEGPGKNCSECRGKKQVGRKNGDKNAVFYETRSVSTFFGLTNGCLCREEQEAAKCSPSIEWGNCTTRKGENTDVSTLLGEVI